MIMKIHQKYWEFPIDATGAAASATKTTQMTVRIASISLNFFFSLKVSTSFAIFLSCFKLNTEAVSSNKQLFLWGHMLSRDSFPYEKVMRVPDLPFSAEIALSSEVIIAILLGFARTNFIVA